MWKVTLETQHTKVVANHILSQTNKPELAQYLHVELFIPTAASLLKEVKQGFPEELAITHRKSHQEAF